MFDRFLSVPRALNIIGLEYTRVVNMPRFYVNCILKILSILNVLSSEYAKVLKYQEFKHAIINGSEY